MGKNYRLIRSSSIGSGYGDRIMSQDPAAGLRPGPLPPMSPPKKPQKKPPVAPDPSMNKAVVPKTKESRASKWEVFGELSRDCFVCRRKIVKDIYLYRLLTFCSERCRAWKMKIDEGWKKRTATKQNVGKVCSQWSYQCERKTSINLAMMRDWLPEHTN